MDLLFSLVDNSENIFDFSYKNMFIKNMDYFMNTAAHLIMTFDFSQNSFKKVWV